ncbi:ABC domain containing protein kinase [Fasciolopsis buskii]|uniref:ABC domain containing protein kinase n=1 Tax=Fasciolopsis buskii TaxID=27845 RepID=A0A8E0RUN5_9TREM|nr:ABC domain containing protein kinase [Fasciolopsis buski]
MQSRNSPSLGVFKGLFKIAEASVKSQADGIYQWWRYSSLKDLVADEFCRTGKCFTQRNLFDTAKFVLDRLNLFARQNVIVCQHLLASQTRVHSVPTLNPPQVDYQSSLAANSEIMTDTSAIINSHQSQPENVHLIDVRSTVTSNEPTAKPTEVIVRPQRTLSEARERRVPSSRIGRIAGFGNLAVGLGLGAAAEWTKRKVGLTGSMDAVLGPDNPFLSEANLQRIVDTLCRMRGAALKLGQMLSIQDDSLVSPQVQKIFERVRQAADFMPARQMRKVLSEELGPDWSNRLVDFEEKPFAAASIGQVHRAKLRDGRTVAMKIQYPGVADSIDADVNNLMSLLNRFNILPRGLFANRAIEVAKRELRAECDYLREAEYCKKFASLLAVDPVFQVPTVIDELTSSRVFTSEFMEGMVLDDCILLPQDVRNWLGEQLLRLCLKEVFVFRTMQTDPNWSNFLYNPTTGKIVLLDFGASRTYDKRFVDSYIRLIHAASERNRQGILYYSHELGFLTGYESKVMEDAHVEAVSILGEAFASSTSFDFGSQSTTKKINQLIPVMIEHRLTPPPDESYSLHRKMSGCFLLCGKLGSAVSCRPLFLQIWNSYTFDSEPKSPT